MPVSRLTSRAAATMRSSSATVAFGSSAASSMYAPSSSSIAPRRSTRPSESRPRSAESVAPGCTAAGGRFVICVMTRSTSVSVGVAADRRDLLLVLHEEDRVHLDVFAWALQADDGRDRRAQRRCERFDARVGRERVLNVLGIDVRAVGEDDHVLLAAAQPQESVLVD